MKRRRAALGRGVSRRSAAALAPLSGRASAASSSVVSRAVSPRIATLPSRSAATAPRAEIKGARASFVAIGRSMT
ncbi:hypothetical protein D3C73_562760 [compost metagenome]